MYLCDTNIVSELARPRPDRSVQAWADTVPHVFLSVITVEEIWFGLRQKPNLRVMQWLEGFLAEYCEILPIDDAIARHGGELRGQLAARGEIRSQADMLIAASAWRHSLTLVTRNTRDFQDCGVQLLNPFQASP